MNILVECSSRILGTGLITVLQEYSPGLLVTDVRSGNAPAAPDVVLFDAGRCSRDFFAAYPKTHYVLLDTGLSTSEISWLLVHHLYKALRTVLSGEVWLDQKNLKALLQNCGPAAKRSGFEALSEQDQRIVDLITHGCRNREIAERLCLCEQTIKSHVSRIFKKLGVNNRAQLASLAMKHHPPIEDETP